MLLHSILPKEAINRMRQEIDFQRAEQNKEALYKGLRFGGQGWY